MIYPEEYQELPHKSLLRHMCNCRDYALRLIDFTRCSPYIKINSIYEMTWKIIRPIRVFFFIPLVSIFCDHHAVFPNVALDFVIRGLGIAALLQILVLWNSRYTYHIVAQFVSSIINLCWWLFTLFCVRCHERGHYSS